MRIAIIGYSGSGKSTLSKHLGTLFDIPVLYLDTVHFLSNWQERNKAEERALVAEFMKNENWVIDGNYTSLFQKERLDQADRIIFMNFSRVNCLIRIYKRFFKYRNTARESMANGCNEKVDLEFLWWVLYKGRDRRKREHYKNTIKTYRNKTVIIRNQKQLDELLLSKMLLQ